MIKKGAKTKVEGAQFNGKSINAYIVKDEYEDEAITDTLCDSISDFYNLMHLIEHSWTHKKYELRMRDAGYEIYDKKDEYLEGWIGVPEKWNCLVFMISCNGAMWGKAEKIKKGPINNPAAERTGYVVLPEKLHSGVHTLFSSQSGGVCTPSARITIFNWDEDWWVYNELSLSNISKEKTEKKQRKIVKSWITETFEGLL